MDPGTKVATLVLGDQLSLSGAALSEGAPEVVMIESAAMCRGRHKRNIAFHISAMRHFRDRLRSKGYDVSYFEWSPDLISGLERYVADSGVKRLRVLKPRNHGGATLMDNLDRLLGIEVETFENNQFMCSQAEFDRWLKDHMTPSIDTFYRMMRETRFVLMEDGRPEGGKWNFDRENYTPPDTIIPSPPAPAIADDALTHKVINEINSRFPDSFGELEALGLPVDRDDALSWEKSFIEEKLENFGPYENLMLTENPVLYRSRTSALLNVGLLLPGECVAMVEAAHLENKVELPSAEGYIRRIMGWREYIAGMYDSMVPEIKDFNYFNARRRLPAFFRDERLTQMNCVKQTVRSAREQGYASHVARLMVLGNFALMARINPREFYKWSMEAFDDASEWACVPNAICLALYADGGLVGRKPYAASAAFINKRSDFCRHCRYSPYERTGEDACPYNFLYWSFMEEEERPLRRSCQMTVPRRTLERMDAREKEAYIRQARAFLDSLDKDERNLIMH